jgi:hypothetical protein
MTPTLASADSPKRRATYRQPPNTSADRRRSINARRTMRKVPRTPTIASWIERLIWSWSGIRTMREITRTNTKFAKACSARSRIPVPSSVVNASRLIEMPTNSRPISAAAAAPAVR